MKILAILIIVSLVSPLFTVRIDSIDILPIPRLQSFDFCFLASLRLPRPTLLSPSFSSLFTSFVSISAILFLPSLSLVIDLFVFSFRKNRLLSLRIRNQTRFLFYLRLKGSTASSFQSLSRVSGGIV